VLSLGALGRGAGLYEVLDVAAHVGEVEVAAQAMESALNPFMAVVMDRSHDLIQHRRGRWNVEPAIVGDHAVRERPWRHANARL